jgi:hypothetical protein
MKEFKYVPDPDQPAPHREGAIRLISTPFSTHENGIPEWIKNSAAAYLRERIEENRIIVLFLNDAR